MNWKTLFLFAFIFSMSSSLQPQASSLVEEIFAEIQLPQTLKELEKFYSQLIQQVDGLLLELRNTPEKLGIDAIRTMGLALESITQQIERFSPTPVIIYIRINAHRIAQRAPQEVYPQELKIRLRYLLQRLREELLIMREQVRRSLWEKKVPRPQF